MQLAMAILMIASPFMMPIHKQSSAKLNNFFYPNNLVILLKFVLTTKCHHYTLYDNLHTHLSQFHIFEAIVKSFKVRTAQNDWMQVKENCPLVISFLSISAD